MGFTLDFLTKLCPGGRPYYKKVLSYAPIAYWPLWEPAGAVANCLVNPAQNGTHVGVTLGQPGIGDGKTCPYFDGANDNTNIYTPTFAGIFNGAEGSLLAWARVAGAGVWTNGVVCRVVTLRADADNRVIVYKNSDSNKLTWFYEANDVSEQIDKDSVSSLDWMCMGFSWSASAGVDGEVKAYYFVSGAGGQQGATQTALGVWAGVLDITSTNIGARLTTPSNVWNGYLAHVAVWTRALPLAAWQDLARI